MGQSHNMSLQVPLQTDGSLKRTTCNVFEWTGEALDEGDLAAEYLSDFMGHKVRLMAYAGEILLSGRRWGGDPTFMLFYE